MLDDNHFYKRHVDIFGFVLINVWDKFSWEICMVCLIPCKSWGQRGCSVFTHYGSVVEGELPSVRNVKDFSRSVGHFLFKYDNLKFIFKSIILF